MLSEIWSEIAAIPHVKHALVPGTYLMLSGLVGLVAAVLVLRRYRGG